MNIAIDLGNTFAKVAVFSEYRLEKVYEQIPLGKLSDPVGENTYDGVIISSVNQDPQKVLATLPSTTFGLVLSHETPVPITHGYATPGTLGMDRLAGVIGANALCPEQNVLVIDAGTCITYDIIDNKGHYHGGSIAPGIGLRFKSLNTFTAHLPLITELSQPPLIGDSTESAIKSGVINGTIAEIKEIIRMYNNKFRDLQIIVCGGDAAFLKTSLDSSVLVEPHLVLIGLNRILLYNV